MKKQDYQDTDFSEILKSRYSRRSFLLSSALLGISGLFNRKLVGFELNEKNPNFPFDGIPSNIKDAVTLPSGYDFEVLLSWGDPLWSKFPQFDQRNSGTSYSQKGAFGDNNDGMECFSIENNRCLMVVNNEYTNSHILHQSRETKTAENHDDHQKSKYAHGVSIFEIKRKESLWELVQDSKLNRRITVDTPMLVEGALKFDRRLNFREDAGKNIVLGTISNCGSGRTPWGTFLTCEEGFKGYFSTNQKNYTPDDVLKRYGVTRDGYGYKWHDFEERFDLSKDENDLNNFGYVVEIDPFSPSSKPVKRSALGRFNHENAELVLSKEGKVVVYMGDDGHGEFLYKYVSNNLYRSGKDSSDLLNEGQLYVAKFYADGKGEWILLNSDSTGMKNPNDILLFTRIAGTAAGGTTMDRPEWVAADPKSSSVYCCLTNNRKRTKEETNGPNPRGKNKYGQIIKWEPFDFDHAATKFRWDIFVLAGNPKVHQDERAGSKNITVENMFACPDGLRFDKEGNMWIQTDGNYTNTGDFEGMGNNQMLMADTKTGQISRFLVGPKECEITGLTWSPDKNTMFVGIQHPGRDGNSNFPDGRGSTPRSSIIAVSRKEKG